MANEKLFMVGRIERNGADLSKPLNWRDASDRIRVFLDFENRDFQIKREGDEWGMVRPGPATWRRLQIVPNAPVGESFRIRNVRSHESYLTRVVEIQHEKPTYRELGATRSVELIAGETWEEFNDRYGLVNMGTYANKPGEHGLHPPNAIDIGVHKPNDADAIHRALIVMAEWQRRMAQDKDHPLYNQINGIIRMYSWCEWDGTGRMSVWRSYGGVPHVSHEHISGRPNPLPGWI